ncbi:hypothetical protein JHW43_002268 [Diplocarpon mali]|nr:hypothetical protein JHW43_002268 [Diplocarpon mali]
MLTGLVCDSHHPQLPRYSTVPGVGSSLLTSKAAAILSSKPDALHPPAPANAPLEQQHVPSALDFPPRFFARASLHTQARVRMHEPRPLLPLFSSPLFSSPLLSPPLLSSLCAPNRCRVPATAWKSSIPRVPARCWSQQCSSSQHRATSSSATNATASLTCPPPSSAPTADPRLRSDQITRRAKRSASSLYAAA